MSNTTQYLDPKARKALKRVEVAQQRGTAPSARELFAYLRPKLLASRPLIEEAKTVTHRPARGFVYPRQGYNVQTVPAKYGKPTFRNVIDPKTGELV